MEAREICFTYKAQDPENEMGILEGLCEGYVRANEFMIGADPDAYPCCSSCGELQYTDPQPCFVRRNGKCKKAENCQRVKGAYELVKTGYGTCIDLACFYCAIKRAKNGEECNVVIHPEYDAHGNPIQNAYHAIVVFADGREVDPSELAKNNAEHGHTCEGSCEAHGAH